MRITLLFMLGCFSVAAGALFALLAPWLVWRRACPGAGCRHSRGAHVRTRFGWVCYECDGSHVCRRNLDWTQAADDAASPHDAAPDAPRRKFLLNGWLMSIVRNGGGNSHERRLRRRMVRRMIGRYLGLSCCIALLVSCGDSGQRDACPTLDAAQLDAARLDAAQLDAAQLDAFPECGYVGRTCCNWAGPGSPGFCHVGECDTLTGVCL